MMNAKTTAAALTLTMVAALAGCQRPAMTPDRAPARSFIDPAVDIGATTLEATLPGRMCGRYFIVDVMINGQGPFPMFLDTGATTTVLDSSFAQRMPGYLIEERQEEVVGAEGGVIEDVRQFYVESMSSGPFAFESFETILLDLSGISGALGEPIAGIMGVRTFHDYVLTLDYPAREVRLAEDTLSNKPFGELLQMKLAPNGQDPFVTIQIGERDLDVLIDSAGATALALPEWERYGVATQPQPVGASATITGTEILEQGRLADDVTIGTHTFEGMLFAPTNGSAKLGTDTMERFIISIDQRARLVRFVFKGEPGAEGKRFVAKRGVAVGFERQADEWRIIEVFQPRNVGGLRAGDVVVGVNGLPIPELGCGTWREIVESSDRLTMLVERDGSQRELSAPVVELVP
jgi:hypothetical protein